MAEDLVDSTSGDVLPNMDPESLCQLTELFEDVGLQTSSIAVTKAVPGQTMVNVPQSPDSFSASVITLDSSAMWSPTPPGLPSPPHHPHISIKEELSPMDLSEAVSPASSSSGPSSSVSVLKKTKKGVGVAGKSIEEELCLICGDRASGYHYNALSCEGCKGFFRRSVTRGAIYNCKYGGNCEMDMWMRRRCQSCRFRRCREVGMKEECLLSDEQCKARDARRKQRTRVQRQQGSVDSDGPGPQTPDSNTCIDLQPKDPHEPLSPGPVLNPLEYITGNNKDIIEKLVIFQDQFELPSEEDVKKISEVRISDVGRPKELSEAIYKHMAEMTILVTQLVVEFAKRLPGFHTIEKEDQINLLKGSACEVMMLRTARRYDIKTDTVVFANGMPFTRDNLRFAGLNDYVEGMFKFCQGMGRMGVDNAEYALITALCIFQEREGMVGPVKLERVQEMYIDALMAYEKLRRPKNSNFLAKLLMKLTELRQLSVEYADVLFSLKVEKGSLPPLLSEYFDVIE